MKYLNPSDKTRILQIANLDGNFNYAFETDEEFLEIDNKFNIKNLKFETFPSTFTIKDMKLHGEYLYLVVEELGVIAINWERY